MPKKERTSNTTAAAVTRTRGEGDSHEYAPNSITIVDGERFAGMPQIMGDFRRVARTYAPVRELFGEFNPQWIGTAVPGMAAGDVPTLEELMRPLLETTTPLLGCISEELIRDLVKFACNVQQTEVDGCNL